MRYYASRDTKEYLDKLLQLRQKPEHNLISVVGGLSFIHAIGPNLNSLYLVDIDANQVEYARLILELIAVSESIWEFFKYVSCRTTTALEPGHLTGIWSNFEELKTKLSEEGYRLYIRHLARFSNCGLNYIVLSEHETLKFFAQEYDINYQHTWFFGYGNLQDNETFLRLKEKLNSVQIRLEVADLAEINYGTCFANNFPVYVAVTNADHFTFCKYDAILHKILATMSVDTTYISWNRNLTLFHNKHHQDCLNKLIPFTRGQNVVETANRVGVHFSSNEIQCARHFPIEYTEIGDWVGEFDTLNYVNDTVFLYHISLGIKGTPKKKELDRLLKTILGRFKRVIFLDWLEFSSLQDYIQIMNDSGFLNSYYISQVEFSGGPNSLSRSIIIVCDLRGITPNVT